MNCRAPEGKTKYRFWLKTTPKTHIDVIATDENDARQQLSNWLKSQGHTAEVDRVRVIIT